ncbi:MAG: TIGR03118 family protein [Acidobacteriia bacterium]|nr:TIGR03118 family protein [Terriglobia bacterium]
MLKFSFLPRSVRRVTLPWLIFAVTSLPSFGQHFTRTDLTVNLSSVSPTAPNLDSNLKNSWGLTRSATSAWWVSDNHTGLATLYDAAGLPQSLVVAIPSPGDSDAIAAPTGAAFNYSSGFEIAPGKKAIFLFVTEDGTISGWNPGVKPTDAVIAFPPAGTTPGDAVYKGCTLVTTTEGTFLYVANFGEGRMDVFDSTFQRVRLGERAFRDLHIPRGFAPFNVQNVGGNVVVTFAKKQHGSDDEAHGPGQGFVAIFDPQGRLLLDLQSGSFLNAPWGITQAPSDFGVFSHRLLVGNQGDGTINAFNLVTGKFEGKLLDANGAPLTIDGLWALNFGSNGTSGSAIELFFTAGPNEEADGLFGKIVPVATEQRGSNE